MKSSPGLERKGTEFKQFAFDSHIPAYITPRDLSKGVLALYFLDKTYITLTPKLQLLTDDLVMQQMKTMMSLQMKYYKNNPNILAIHLLKYQYQKYEIKKAIFEKGVKEVFEE